MTVGCANAGVDGCELVGWDEVGVVAWVTWHWPDSCFREVVFDLGT